MIGPVSRRQWEDYLRRRVETCREDCLAHPDDRFLRQRLAVAVRMLADLVLYDMLPFGQVTGSQDPAERIGRVHATLAEEAPGGEGSGCEGDSESFAEAVEVGAITSASD